MRGPREEYHRRLSLPAVSLALVFLQLALAVLHMFPALVFSDSPTVRVLVFINHLGPWWVLGFGASGAALLVALRVRRFRHLGHLGCAFVWVVYATALWIGAYAVSPPGPIRLAIVCTGLAVVHLVTATQYADDPAEGA